ncbi:MAG: hypothetical protein OXC26_24500 [Albidovulum sp.]|nr:hypothetical protein [Albidovulum sp.]
MPASIVIGGRFGSEGRGGTALEIVKPLQKSARYSGPAKSQGKQLYRFDFEFSSLNNPECLNRNVVPYVPSGVQIQV